MSTFDPTTVPVRDAATVMLVRSGPAGPEVLMQRRTLKAAFVGGFYVFPGGAIDESDRDGSLERLASGLTDAQASRRLGVATGGLASWVAAVRECFEEAGVLLADNRDGRPVRFDDPLVAARFGGHRTALHDGRISLAELCGLEGLRLALARLHYVSHWVTPTGEKRRFDTRFFVGEAPAAQTPLHDDRETIDTIWISPAEALARNERGELSMIVPTIRNLQFLASYADLAGVIAAARAVVDPPTIQPRMSRVGDDLQILLPGDTGFEEAG